MSNLEWTILGLTIATALLVWHIWKLWREEDDDQ